MQIDGQEQPDEKRLVLAWQRGFSGSLRLSDGRRLHVVYRGRCLGGAGPDIRGALLAFDEGRLLEGDVEFHWRSSDWFAHGHQNDPRYRTVILHVVVYDDAPAPSDGAGDVVPTLVVSLADLPPSDSRGEWPDVVACHRRARSLASETLGGVLDQLGDRRLLEHAARFEAELTRLPPSEVAYQAALDALGFSRNRAAFARLAEATPIAFLASLVGRRPFDEALDVAQALLFGVAGLLPSQRPTGRIDWDGDRLVGELESIWALYRRDWDGLGLDASSWVFGGVRPANYPTRRIAAAARLVVRFREEGLAEAMITRLRAPLVTVDALEDIFVDEYPTSYWSAHSDFGQILPRAPIALLGRDRARDAVVNVVLPFALAVSVTEDDPALTDAVWMAYRGFPRPAAYQAVKKLSEELGVGGSAVRTARRQQGLLHLLRNHCDQAACVACPLTEAALAPEPVEPTRHQQPR